MSEVQVNDVVYPIKIYAGGGPGSIPSHKCMTPQLQTLDDNCGTHANAYIRLLPLSPLFRKYTYKACSEGFHFCPQSVLCCYLSENHMWPHTSALSSLF